MSPSPPLGQYDTKLSPAEEQQFRQWKAKNAPNDSGADYDLRGAFKGGFSPAANGHWPDRFKKPNHPTFSTQSQYSGTGDNAGGQWLDSGGKTYFVPGAANLKNQSLDDLQGYFNKYEPDSILGTPQPAYRPTVMPPMPVPSGSANRVKGPVDR